MSVQQVDLFIQGVQLFSFNIQLKYKRRNQSRQGLLRHSCSQLNEINCQAVSSKGISLSRGICPSTKECWSSKPKTERRKISYSNRIQMAFTVTIKLVRLLLKLFLPSLMQVRLPKELSDIHTNTNNLFPWWNKNLRQLEVRWLERSVRRPPPPLHTFLVQH